MVLATRTSAPNTSLAVIRPKPRPDSPTASEISVIMLKSELPHEASNPVSKKTARVHHAARRRGGRVALQRIGPVAAQASTHRPSPRKLEGGGRALLQRLCIRYASARLPGKPRLRIRGALRRWRCVPPAVVGGRVGQAQARCDRGCHYSRRSGGEAGNGRP